MTLGMADHKLRTGRARRARQPRPLKTDDAAGMAAETGRDPGGADDLRLHLVFKALADPTRRRILDLIKHRPATTGALCDEFRELSRFAVMKHLKVLERANLVSVRRSGRERYNYINHVPIRMVYERWMGPYAELWSSSLLRLRDHVENTGNQRIK